MTITQSRNHLLTSYLLKGLALIFLVSSLPALALRFEPTDELTIDLDTTLAYGAMWRVEEQMGLDPPHAISPTLSQADAEFQDFVLAWNSDDGDRNFEKGDLVSDRYAVTSDFDMRRGDYGLFLRAQIFYDSVYFEETSWDGKGWDDWRGGATLDCYDATGVYNPGVDGLLDTSDTGGGCDPGNARVYNGLGVYAGPESLNNSMAAGEISDPSHFSEKTKDRHGYDARFLDAYIYGTFPIGDKTLDLRLGRQALGWGEALMLQGGIGFAVNRIDAAAATSPGVELKEIFLPTGSLYGQLNLSDTLTLEAYWQYEWKPSELFATGSYFSAQDFLESDVLLVNVGFNANCMFGLGKTFNTGADTNGVGGTDSCSDPNTLIDVGTEHWLDNNPNAMYKSADVEPDHQSDQFGVALRFLLDGGSEGGVYFVQYHDKYPSLWAGNNGAKDSSIYAQSNDILGLGGIGYGDPNWVGGPVSSVDVEGFNSQSYTIQYKERIKLYGLTYNTVIKDIQMGFELTYRENQPIVPACTDEMLAQATFDETLPEGFGYLDYVKGLTMKSPCKDESAKHIAGYAYDFTNDAFDPGTANKLLGWPAEAEVFTYNYGVTLVVPPSPLWDTGIFVAEFGGWYVGGYENEDLKVTSIGGFTKTGNGASAIFLPQYKNVYEGVDLTIPLFVNYTLDGSFSYFAYNEKALWASIGVEAVYLSNLRVGLVYSAFGGANNMWRDRDNIAFNMKYTF